MTSILLAAQAAGQQGGGLGMIIMLVAIFVIMWLFMIRPQQKRAKMIRKFQNSLQEGASVVIGGGIYATVKRINMEKGTIDVEIAHGVVVTVDKSAVFADVAQGRPNQ